MSSATASPVTSSAIPAPPFARCQGGSRGRVHFAGWTTEALSRVDVDAYVAAHNAEWRRLEWLINRGRKLTGAEADELVELYQRTATHLSVIRSSSPDPELVGAAVLAGGAGQSGGGRRPSSALAGRHPVRDVSFPAVAYRMRWWWIGCAVLGNLVALALAIWIVHSPEVQAGLGRPRDPRPGRARLRQLLHRALGVVLRVPGVGQQRVGVGRRADIRDPARHSHRVRAAAQPGQPRPARRPDVRLRQGRRLLRPDPPARPAGADRRVPGLRRGTETRLDDHRSGAAPPQPGARRGGPRRRQHRHRSDRSAAGVRPHRGLRHRPGAHTWLRISIGVPPRPRSSPTSSSSGDAPPGRARPATPTSSRCGPVAG